MKGSKNVQLVWQDDTALQSSGAQACSVFGSAIPRVTAQRRGYIMTKSGFWKKGEVVNGCCQAITTFYLNGENVGFDAWF